LQGCKEKQTKNQQNYSEEIGHEQETRGLMTKARNFKAIALSFRNEVLGKFDARGSYMRLILIDRNMEVDCQWWKLPYFVYLHEGSIGNGNSVQ